MTPEEVVKSARRRLKQICPNGFMAPPEGLTPAEEGQSWGCVEIVLIVYDDANDFRKKLEKILAHTERLIKVLGDYVEQDNEQEHLAKRDLLKHFLDSLNDSQPNKEEL